MKEEYYDQAVACVKDHVLPAQRELYTSCGADFDKVYGEASELVLCKPPKYMEKRIYALQIHKRIRARYCISSTAKVVKAPEFRCVYRIKVSRNRISRDSAFSAGRALWRKCWVFKNGEARRKQKAKVRRTWGTIAVLELSGGSNKTIS